MEFEFVQDSRNELLSRREIQFRLTYSGATPSRAQVLGKLCALLNLKESLVVLDSLKTAFGAMQLKGAARVYDSEEAKKRTEPAHLSARGVPKPAEGVEAREAAKETKGA